MATTDQRYRLKPMQENYDKETLIGCIKPVNQLQTSY